MESTETIMLPSNITHGRILRGTGGLDPNWKIQSGYSPAIGILRNFGTGPIASRGWSIWPSVKYVGDYFLDWSMLRKNHCIGPV